MNQVDKLEKTLKIVRCLRIQFSIIMKIINEHRESYKTQFKHPPEEINLLMSKAQDIFSELLKSEDFLTTAQENIKLQRGKTVDDYLEQWVISQTNERLQVAQHFIEQLNQQAIQGLKFDHEVLHITNNLLVEGSELLKIQ